MSKTIIFVGIDFNDIKKQKFTKKKIKDVEVFPSVFKNRKSWPEKTKFKCYNCSNNYNIYIPIFRCKVMTSDSIFTGVPLCSFPCYRKLLEKECKTKEELEKELKNMKILYERMTMMKMNFIIEPSWDRSKLIDYGGNESKENYMNDYIKKNPDIHWNILHKDFLA